MDETWMYRREAIAGLVGSVLLGPVACRAAPVSRASLLDYLPTRQHRGIAEGNSDFDCSPDLQRALRETAAAGATLWVPRGTYLLTPTQALRHADPQFECLAAVRLVSNMRLTGEAGSILRMAAGYSSDRHPRAMVMFGTTEALSNIEISGLTLDMNGRNNPISPDRARRNYHRFPQAQIFVSSRNDAAAARIDRIHIADTVFCDANGVSCIVMAQTNDPKASLGRGWALERCVFTENGMDTDDHSSIFAYAEDVSIAQCRFINDHPFDGVGVNTAYEIHGSRQRITKCLFKNMIRGIWVANNYSTDTRGSIIKDNEFHTIFYGVDFFSDRATAKPIYDTQIINNRFYFDDYRLNDLPRLDFKAAVQVASEFGQQSIRVVGNAVTKNGYRVTSAFLVVTGGASGMRRHDNITASDNRGSGLTFGSFLRTSRVAGLGRFTLLRNHWTGLAPSDVMGIAAGDVLERTDMAQPIQSVALGGGQVRDAQGKTSYGIFVNTIVRSLELEPLATSGLTGAAYEVGGAGKVLAQRGRIQ